MNNEERIGHLETKCRRLTLALSGMMMMAVAMLFIAAKPKADNDAIQTRKLEVVDENGKVRIRLRSEPPSDNCGARCIVCHCGVLFFRCCLI